MMDRLGFTVIWLSSLLLVHEVTELNLIAFTIAPEPSPDASKSTWQWYFDELQFVRGKVYDVCDVLPKLLRNVSSIYGVRLVTCRQQPRNQPSDSRTTAEIFFDGTYFNQTQYTRPCMDKIAAEIQNILHGNLTNNQLSKKTKLFTVTVQHDTIGVYAFTLHIGLSKTHKPEEFVDDMGALVLKTSFDARRAFISHRLSAITEVEPLVVEMEKVQASKFWFKIFLNIYLKKEGIAQMSARDLYSSLDRIHSVDEEDAEDSDPSVTIVEIGNWNHAPQRKKLSDYLNVITHACTTFSSERIQIVRIDGPVYVNGVEASNPGASRARSAVVQQIMDVANTSQNKVPVPQNIEFVSSYGEPMSKGIYELNFNPPTGRSIAPELRKAFQKAIAGFSNDSAVQEHIENCLVSSQEIQVLDYQTRAHVQNDKKWLIWESTPSESSEEYKKIKDDVIQYILKYIEKTRFAKNMIAMRVNKMFSNHVKEVYVELRITFELIGTIQAIGYSTHGQPAREPRIAVASALKHSTWDEAEVVPVILEREYSEIHSTRIVCGDVFKPFAGFLVEPKPHSMDEHMEHHMAGHGHGTGDNGKHGEAYMQGHAPKAPDFNMGAKGASSDRSACKTPLSILFLVPLLLIEI